MSSLSTHVLNTANGKPAVGLSVLLESYEAGQYILIKEGITNTDGRITDFPKLTDGSNKIFRITFFTEDYFKGRNEACFYPKVSIEFYMKDESHYHVPLLISPYGYSTYRGS